MENYSTKDKTDPASTRRIIAQECQDLRLDYGHIGTTSSSRP
ncbi:hypothetical protein OMCYN_00410 [cyanobiont of Ornithocercus magnificus]|nr:hypothetical protein OMCYN_00410 [cyanobiont of Ornithocercus magnificus]